MCVCVCVHLIFQRSHILCCENWQADIPLILFLLSLHEQPECLLAQKSSCPCPYPYGLRYIVYNIPHTSLLPYRQVFFLSFHVMFSITLSCASFLANSFFFVRFHVSYPYVIVGSMHRLYTFFQHH